MSEKKCGTCLYQDPVMSCRSEQCDDRYSGWRPKWDQPITFVDKVKADLPREEKFSLDKLIDDHWKYNEGLVKLCFPYGVDGWETDDILRLVEFAYKQSGKHFWKHCVEHYGIEEKNDD